MGSIISFFNEPLQRSIKVTRKRSTVGSFIETSGFLYMVIGTVFMLAPEAGCDIVHYELKEGQAEMLTIAGIFAFLVGFFYVVFGRSESKSGAAATLFHKLVILPVGLVWCHAQKGLPINFCFLILLDGCLGLVQYFLLRTYGYPGGSPIKRS